MHHKGPISPMALARLDVDKQRFVATKRIPAGDHVINAGDDVTEEARSWPRNSLHAHLLHGSVRILEPNEPTPPPAPRAPPAEHHEAIADLRATFAAGPETHDGDDGGEDADGHLPDQAGASEAHGKGGKKRPRKGT